MKTRWYKDMVIYQIYPRSFMDSNGDGIGDIKGIIDKLDYIKDLGVGAIWLSPIYKSPNDDNGYDISDYLDIMDEFGTLEDFKLLSSEMKKRDLKLIMDLVVNHTSDEHKWFKESRKSKDNKYRDYYIWKKPGPGKKKPNNWTSNFAGSCWEYDENTKEYYMHLFSKKQPDLNWDNENVRKEIANIVNYWLEIGVDGFRCDVITYISKNPKLPHSTKLSVLKGQEHYVIGPNWVKYIQELADNSFNKPEYDSMTVGECAGMTFEMAQKTMSENNNTLDTFFQFEHCYSDTYFMILPRKFSLVRFKKIFDKWNNIGNNCWNSIFYENHDLPRSVSYYTSDKPEYREYASKMLATSIFFHKATPYVYQGQEIGMTNYPFKPDEYADIMSVNILKTVKKYLPLMYKWASKILQRRARDNARTPMQWDDSNNAGFSQAKPWFLVNPNYKTINVKNALADKNSIYYFYQNIIALKKKHAKLLRDGDYETIAMKNKKVYCYKRELNNEVIIVICNFTAKSIEFMIDTSIYKKVMCIAQNYDEISLSSKCCELKPFETIVLHMEK